jgi:RHS repeat-associated protein
MSFGRRSRLALAISFLVLIPVIVVSLPSVAPAGSPAVTSAGSSAPPKSEPPTPQRGHGDPAGDPELTKITPEPASGDIASLRTRNSRTYLSKTGEHVAFIYQGSVNYKDEASTWQRIDNTLVPSSIPGYAYENAANSYKVLLPANLSDAPVKFRVGDQWVAFSLEHSNSQAQVSGDTITYPHAVAGADLIYQAGNEQVSESLSLHSSASAHALVFELQTSPGLSATQDAAGGIDFNGLVDNAPFSFAPPVMHDGDVKPSSGPVAMNLGWDASGQTVSLTPDQTWLDKPGRQFPVVIDPSVTLSPAQMDCTIAQATPTTSLCANTTMKLGDDGTNRNRLLLQFNLSSIPAQQVIQNAQLNLYMTSSTTGNNTGFGLHRVFRSWTNSATWNKYDGTNTWTNPGADGDYGSDPWDERWYSGVGAGWKGWWPTGLQQYWEDGSATNFGMLLKTEVFDASDPNVFTFVSSESTDSSHWPNLVVNYGDRIGEQRFFKFYSSALDDHMQLNVNVTNGDLVINNHDFTIHGIGQDFSLDRAYSDLYNSDDGLTLFGPGWASSHWPFLNFWTDGSATYADPSGYRVRFVSNGDGSFDSPSSIDADLTYNSGDGTYTLTWHKNGTKWKFASDGDISTETDRNGNVLTFTKDPNGNITQVTDTEGRNITLTYQTVHSAARVTQITDPSSRIYQYGYDSATGHLTSYTDPANGSTHPTTYGYNGSGDLNSITDPRGLQSTIGYDSSSRVSSVTSTCSAAICGTATSRTWNFTYNSGNTVLTDPNSHATTYTYNGASQVTDILDANSKHQALVYNSDGNVKNYSDQVGFDLTDPTFNWSAEYDTTYPEEHRKTILPTVSGVSAALNEFTYDNTRTDFQQYFPTSVKNGSVTVWNYAYNCKHNLKTVSDTIGNAFTYHYYDGCTADGDPAGTTGLISSTVDARGKTTSFSYAFSGTKLASATVTPPAPQTASIVNFDLNTGRVTSAVSGNDHKQVPTYDNLDRVTRTDFYAHSADPSPTSFVTYAYDGDGNLTQRVDNTGTTTFEYKDPYNRQTKKVAGDGTTFNYTYDGVNLLTFADPSGTTTYAYNSRNLVTSVTEPNSKQTTFAYDIAGNRVYTKFPSNVYQYTGYDGAGRICNIAASTTVLTADSKSRYLTCTQTVTGTILGYKYKYDDPGTMGVDTLLRQSVTDQAGNKATYSYDEDLRLHQVVNTGSPSNTFTYNYDGDANMTSLVNSSPSSTTSFVYDDASELCWSGTTTPPANCTTHNYTYDGSGNELTSPTYTFAYNEKDQTTSVTPSGGSAVSMAYANRGQAQRTSWGTRTFADGQLGLTVDKPASGSTVYYNRDPGGGLIGERIGTASYYFVTDALGSVMGVFDATSSTPVNTYKYDPWGGLTSSTGSTYNQWRYAQAFADVYSTGTLDKFGTRYYDPSTMRWTQPDPAGGGYLYVDDNPTNWTDRSGLYFPGDTGQVDPGCWAGCGGDQVSGLIHSISHTASSAASAVGNFVGHQASVAGGAIGHFFTQTLPHFVAKIGPCALAIAGEALALHELATEIGIGIVEPELAPFAAAAGVNSLAHFAEFNHAIYGNCS